MKTLIKVLLIIWQLPQVVVGLFLLLFYKKSLKLVYETDYDKVYACDIPGGISLGCFVLLNKYYCTKFNIEHELGHCKQSRYLGPLYLIIIGLPSILHAWLHECEKYGKTYYHFFTEKWANIIAGLKARLIKVRH